MMMMLNKSDMDQMALSKYHFDYKDETPTASVVSKSSQKSLTVT